jgi:hypothetical protein
MSWIRSTNRVGTWVLIIVPVLWSGIGNLREQFGYGTGERWQSWSDVLFGWGMWIIGVLIWVALVRGITGWIDRKLSAS